MESSTLCAVWTYGDFLDRATYQKCRKEERSDWVLKLIQRRQIHQLPQNADLNTCRTPLNKVNQFSFTNPLQTFMNLNPYRKTKSWHSIVELLKYLHTKTWYFTITSQFGQAATMTLPTWAWNPCSLRIRCHMWTFIVPWSIKELYKSRQDHWQNFFVPTCTAISYG